MIKLSLTFLLLTGLTNLFAQLSPGDLANSHKNLEGMQNCTKCHEFGKKVSPDKCLACHVLLNDRIKLNKGLHSQKEYQNCTQCHSDHHGSAYKLIWWKDKQENFDHSITGYVLEGKHAKINCRQCHQGKFILNQDLFRSNNKDLAATFLGLRQECLTCHRDEHRGQMVKDSRCLACHQMAGWKPAEKFNHSSSKFSLNGKHKTVLCASCHKNIVDKSQKSAGVYAQYTGLRYETCTSCHKDPHLGRLGLSCTNCHSTAGWQGVKDNRINHDKTRFPLLAKHKSVKCAKCHTTNRSLRALKFRYCSNCHKDYHQRQFIKRPQKGACEDCHTVEGFKPADFTLVEHNQTGYHLEGSHLAVPCLRCHQKTYYKTERFTFNTTECTVCHTDPHKGAIDQYVRFAKSDPKKVKCGFCHTVESWEMIKFDHSQTEFKLEGKHQSAKCSSCHRETDKKDTNSPVKFKISGKFCQDCHNDIHIGQFSEKITSSGGVPGISRCDRCHSHDDWSAARFNHDRDSRFKLAGVHRDLKCIKCHKKNSDSPDTAIIYKPLDTACKTCHGNIPVNLGVKRL